MRGAHYLVDGVKESSADAAFALRAVEAVKTQEKVDNVAALPTSVLHHLRAEGGGGGTEPSGNGSGKGTPEKGAPLRFFVLQLQMPGYAIVCYFERNADASDAAGAAGSNFDRALRRFVDGDAAARRARLKLIPRVVEGGWIVRKSVGEKPAILGKALKVAYSAPAADALEADVDVSSSYVAQKVLGIVKGVAKSLVLDLAFLVEGKGADELPERILGAIRLHRPDLSKFPPAPAAWENAANN